MDPDTNSAPSPARRVTEILDDVRRGEPGAQDALYSTVYAELRRVAAGQLRRGPRGQTLQPTALVHEAYLRLLGAPAAPFEDRAHFFGSAARAMRSIVIDAARARLARKRGGGRLRVTLDADRISDDDGNAREVIAVHEALSALERDDPAMARVVELRFFAGLTVEETARALGVTERTVFRQWNFARAWLHREIGG